MSQSRKIIQQTLDAEYAHGYTFDFESDVAPAGISEAVIRFISQKKQEPSWLLDWRLKAFAHWLTLKEPTWGNVSYPAIDYQTIRYYAAPKSHKTLESLDEVDPKLLAAFERLGIPLSEQKRLTGVAVDAIMDSVSVATTCQKQLAEYGVIFCAFSQAVQTYPDLVKRYLGSVVPYSDHFFAALNAAVFSDGAFVYIPKGVTCPIDLSSYFRINTQDIGQFERTLIVAEEGAQVTYLEGCTAPSFDTTQLHAAVVELVAQPHAIINYATVQNWYPGDKNGNGGVYNFVTKRGIAYKRAKITWTQVETGSAITWKYPSCILRGEGAVGEFYSVAVTKHHQQADTGTKMLHFAPNTRSTIISKGISAGHGQNTYRGLVKVAGRAQGSRNFSQCDSLLIGDDCGAHTFPHIQVGNETSIVEHEATTSRLSAERLRYLQQRGLTAQDAMNLVVTGFCKEVFGHLPLEFAVEVEALLGLTLEDSVG